MGVHPQRGQRAAGGESGQLGKLSDNHNAMKQVTD